MPLIFLGFLVSTSCACSVGGIQAPPDGIAPRRPSRKARGCGVFAINTGTGDIVNWLRLSGVVSELFDIALIWRAGWPNLIGFRSDEIRRVFLVDESAMAG